MGMYTELVFASRLKRNTPQDVVDILRAMTEEEGYELLNIPGDNFFKCDRWRWLFTCDSYYFDGETNTIFTYDDILKTYILTIRSNLKNYNLEIQKFLKWIKPYLDKYEDDFLGYYRYEEDESPTLIYMNNIDKLLE